LTQPSTLSVTVSTRELRFQSRSVKYYTIYGTVRSIRTIIKAHDVLLFVMAVGGGEVSKLVTIWLTNLSQAADHESWGQPVEASDLYKKYF